MAKVYVGGPEVGRSIAKEDLEDKFAPFGRLVSVWVARQPPGFAFIEYEDPRDADDAVRDMNHTEILGCTINCEISKGRGRGGPEIKPGDWPCRECGVNNFSRRDVCFRCSAPRGGYDRGDRYDDRRDRYDDRRDRYDDRGRGGYDRYDDRYDDRDRYSDRGRGGYDRYDDRYDDRDRYSDRSRNGYDRYDDRRRRSDSGDRQRSSRADSCSRDRRD